VALPLFIYHFIFKKLKFKLHLSYLHSEQREGRREGEGYSPSFLKDFLKLIHSPFTYNKHIGYDHIIWGLLVAGDVVEYRV
jgi:hypothetical protein